MTGRPLAISQRQVEALAKGAVKAGCRVEIKIGDVVVTLVPNAPIPAIWSNLAPTEEELDRELDAFKLKHGYV